MFWEHFTPNHTVLEITCIWVCTYSVSLQRCDFKHFLQREFKVEYIEVFLDSAWSNRLYQWQHACLHHPTDNYLSYTLAMVGSNRLQERIIQHITSSQWAPCFHKNVVLLAELNTLLLGESMMILYLVNHRTLLALHDAAWSWKDRCYESSPLHADAPSLSKYLHSADLHPCQTATRWLANGWGRGRDNRDLNRSKSCQTPSRSCRSHAPCSKPCW